MDKDLLLGTEDCFSIGHVEIYHRKINLVAFDLLRDCLTTLARMI